MQEQAFNVKDLGDDYANLVASINKNENCSIFGMGLAERILSCLSVQGKVLYVTYDLQSAKKMQAEFNKLLGENGCDLFCPGSDIVTYKRMETKENNILRLKTCLSLVKNTSKVIVAPIESLCYFLPKKEAFLSNLVSIKASTEIDVSKLGEQLVKMGYKREQLVTEPGGFSIRGFVLDIFPINQVFPSRIELFDNYVETIHLFDPRTQVAGERQTEVIVCPNTNLFLTKEDFKAITQGLNKQQKKVFVSREEESRFNGISAELLEGLKNYELSFSKDFVFPFIEKSLGTIFDYLDNGFTIVYDECKMVYDAINSFYKELKERHSSAIGYGDHIESSSYGLIKKQELFNNLNKFCQVAFQKITNANKLFEPKKVFSFHSGVITRYVHAQENLIKDLDCYIDNDYKILIFAGNYENAEKLKSRLQKKDVYLEINPKLSFGGNKSGIIPKELTTGFILEKEKIIVIGTNDIFPIKKQSDLFKSKRDVFSVPKLGDYVVHRIHGVGKCEGITKLTGNFGTKDFVVVAYRGADKLYVPIDQMDLLDKYAGAGEPKRLSKLGGSEFSLVKERVKKQIKEMAFSLLKLYAERDAKKGVVYPKDDDLVMEFENSFPYTETEDQLLAIQEIKEDMETGRVMDRLVCGDVGFGKTEVALRAAFKTIVGGKQVAFLAPTTLLARQHYNTAVSRLGKFGVRVESLDRFKTNKEAKQVLEDLAKHKVDLVCGTHRLLSSDVAFEDLGLVILDEEQKFGVEHKEKIKLDNKSVNVLTLSATPIPRTLHMSLSGIRDISVISSPPRDRLPVQTYVTEISDGLIKDVIKRELGRGGQVFVVYNRVETIYNFSKKIQDLVPEARVVVGHGQLSGNELEDVVYKFYNHLADVLICTTIIENGIDLPNANSLIVMDSDKFGLSQLYQIRGRVGRGSKEGFAYFTYKKGKVLSEDSYKRLEAIAEYTDFGSGFKIALKDLEIRGSGNIFGAEQHGHIEKVGYELYSKMLKDAVLELKGKKVEEELEVQVKISLDAFIPDEFITSSEDRMSLYKSIAQISSLEEKEKIIKDIINYYGTMPAPIRNLIEIAYTKHLAKFVGATEIFISPKEMKITLGEKAENLKSEGFIKTLNAFSSDAVLFLSGLPIIKFKNLKQRTQDNLFTMQQFLTKACENIKK